MVTEMTTRHVTFKYQGVEYAVFSDAEPRTDLSKLTQAERAVMALVVEGLSNAQVAKQRKTAVRTVANQLQSLFRKLKVGSRAELIAKVSR